MSLGVFSVGRFRVQSTLTFSKSSQNLHGIDYVKPSRV